MGRDPSAELGTTVSDRCFWGKNGGWGVWKSVSTCEKLQRSRENVAKVAEWRWKKCVKWFQSVKIYEKSCFERPGPGEIGPQ